MYFFDGQFTVASTSAAGAINEFILGICTTSLYIFLFCALGYLIGTLVQVHKVFVIIVPALFFGALFLGEVIGNTRIVTNFFGFIFTESSILLFMTKIIISCTLVFAGSFVLSNRMEVRQ